MCSSSKPLIEFPCEYPIKIIGDGSSMFTDHIESVMTNTIGLGNYSKISEKYSKNIIISSKYIKTAKKWSK